MLQAGRVFGMHVWRSKTAQSITSQAAASGAKGFRIVSVNVGKGECFRTNASLSLDHRVSIFRQSDVHSSEALEYQTAVQNVETREWRSPILKQFGHDVCELAPLAVDKMEIKKKYNGNHSVCMRS